MARHRLGFQQLLGAGLLAGALGSAGAAAPGAAAPSSSGDEEVMAMAREIDTLLGRSFDLPKTMKLDPELRAQAESMRAAHLERVRQLLPVWLREEPRLQGGGKVRDRAVVFYAVAARVLNELALWQIEPGNPVYEQATLEVLKTAPRVCNVEGDARYADFASRIARLQAVPPAQRQAMLDEERALLAQWGKPRAAVPAWPSPMPQEAGMALVVRMRAEGPPSPLGPAPVLTPLLASELLARHQDYADLPAETKCLFQQWWLRASLAQGATPAAALNAFRYGTMISAMARLGQGVDDQDPAATARAEAIAAEKGIPPYPRLATVFDVQGRTMVRRQLDAAGKPVQASVVGRDITVRGIRGVRPVAFESTFDTLSMKYGLKTKVTAKPEPDNSQVFQMVWSLDGSAPPQAGGKPQGDAK